MIVDEAINPAKLVHASICELESHGIEGAQAEILALFEKVFGASFAKTLTDDNGYEPNKIQKFMQFLDKRLAGVPLAYLVGESDFMGNEFQVGEGVLIPRKETECIVEAAVEYSNNLKHKKSVDVIDLGTGSGCITLTLEKLFPQFNYVAVDKSDSALRYATKNAKRMGSAARFLKMDYLKDAWSQISKVCYDLILANPPYISEADYHSLQKEVKCEPKEALVSGLSGLEICYEIFHLAQTHLTPDGRLIMEIGYGQLSSIQSYIKDQTTLVLERILKDDRGVSRVLVISRSSLN